MGAAGPRRRSSIAGEVGARVRALRESQGLSQVELARRAGTGRAALRLIEEGRRDPSLTTVDSLARALGVAVVVLFSTEKVRTPSRQKQLMQRLARVLEGRDPEELEAIETVVGAVLRALRRGTP